MPVCRVDGILSCRAFLLQQTHGFFHFYGHVFVGLYGNMNERYW